jgi:hypothetical protein
MASPIRTAPATPPRRPRFHQHQRRTLGCFELREAAIRLHAVIPAIDLLIRQRVAQIGEIARHDRLNVSGEHSRVRALILTPLAGYFVACSDRNAGQHRAQSLRGSHLVRRIDVSMQEYDRDRLDIGRCNRIRDDINRGHGKRHAHLALCVDTLGDFEAQMPRHERFARRGMKIVKVGTIAAADRDDVAKAFSRDQRRAHTLSLGDGVDHCRSAVNEKRNIVGRQPGLATLCDRMNDALRRVLRRGQRLANIDFAGCFFEGDGVGERAAGVRGNFDHRAAPRRFARSSSVAARSTFCVSGWITTP